VGIKLVALPQMCVVAQQNTVIDLHIIQTQYYYYCCCCRSTANHIHMQRKKRSLMQEGPTVIWMKS